MRIALCLACLGLCLPAFAIQELWQIDTGCASHAYPLVTNYDGKDEPEVVFTTRFDGTAWVLRADGTVLTSLRRDHWVGGSAAVAARGDAVAPLLAIQESNGGLALLDMDQGQLTGGAVRGEPQLGNAPCFVNLDSAGDPELVVARRDGRVTALNSQLVPLWQFDAGAPVEAMPAGAPIFRGQGAIYVVASDGRVHGVSGQGRPLWFFAMDHPAPTFPAVAEPLVAQLAFTQPSVLVSDAEGWLYAVNSVRGTEEWRVRAGHTALGSPAIFDMHPNAGREILTVSESGEITLTDATGSMLAQASLPAGRYVPRPVVADIDGDDRFELVVANSDWQLVVASLDGHVKETVALQGNVREGVVLANLRGDDRLEMLAVTDCARMYCFGTQARDGWTHPRANGSLNGCVDPIPPSVVPTPDRMPRAAAPEAVVLPEFTEESPFATAWIDFDARSRAAAASVVIRQGEIVLGSATQTLRAQNMTVPYVRFNSDAITLDVYLYGSGGRMLAATEGFVVRPRVSQPVPLTPPEPLFRALETRAATFSLPARWQLPRVADRDSWHVAGYMPEQWRRYGLADEPFIRDAVPLIQASAGNAEAVFQPGHPAWEAVAADPRPFFVAIDDPRPTTPYPASAVEAINAMAGGRFLGFAVQDWASQAWRALWADGSPRPASPSEAMALLRADFQQILDRCQGRVYEGQGHSFFHHQAFAWGAPMGYAEVGENIPCAPLQFAFLRGAARQYGGRPWGVSVSNWFEGAVADARYREGGPAVAWVKPGLARGLDCGHSASLEYRLEMAAHLAGATFVHHAADTQNGSIFVRETAPGRFEASDHGRSIRTWFDYAQKYADRGVPYTPIAFLVDSEHGWRPGENRFGIWRRDRADLSMENMFAHVFPCGTGLDFERGYLAAGPYGDIFDVITADAAPEVLRSYPVIWPVGGVQLASEQARALQDYVRQGGILILDTAQADSFPADFVGARFKDRYAYGNQIQTAVDAIPPFGAPFRYQPMWVLRGSEVIANADDGAPLVVWRREGEGVIIASGTHHWADETDQTLPLVPALMKALVRAFVPIRVTGDVEVFLSRTPFSWIVGVMNHNGITKTPFQPAEINPAGAQECSFRFPGMVPQRFVNRKGDFKWDPRADVLLTRLQPGEVAVVEVVLGGQTAPPAP